MTQQQLLDGILAKVRKELPENQYKMWFSRMGIASWEADAVELEVPNTLVRDWLLRHYSELIKRAVQSASASPVEVSLEVNPALSRVEASVEGNSVTENCVEDVPEAERSASRFNGLIPNPVHTFENFIVGPCNSLAVAAAQAVVDSPGTVYNPLFVHGAAGLGKTHVLQAICHRSISATKAMTIHYTTCETFMSEFISAVQSNSVPGFRERFRHVDFLIIDDVDFLGVGSRERTQEEFFHTFNALYNERRQIVVSSDSPPEQIPKIQRRLVSRFQWGLVAKLEPPAFETRCAIVKKKAELKGRSFPDPVIEFIAENFTQHIRELEGAVNRVIAFSAVMNRAINLPSARKALSEIISEPSPSVSVEEVISAVAHEFKIKPAELQSRKRPNSIVLPRQLCMYLCKKLTSYSLEEIGGYLGGRDHTTVLYGYNKIARLVRTDEGMARLVERIIAFLSRENPC